jgi:hypothetical protein
MIETYRIRRVEGPDPVIAAALADVTIDAVESGASIGFMLPLTRERTLRFWNECMAGVARGERILLVAEETATGAIDGTVQVILAMPDNQPHRGDIAKMQVHRRARRLLAAAASAARISAAPRPRPGRPARRCSCSTP